MQYGRVRFVGSCAEVVEFATDEHFKKWFKGIVRRLHWRRPRSISIVRRFCVPLVHLSNAYTLFCNRLYIEESESNLLRTDYQCPSFSVVHHFDSWSSSLLLTQYFTMQEPPNCLIVNDIMIPVLTQLPFHLSVCCTLHTLVHRKQP